MPAPRNGAYVSLWALIAIDELGPKAAPVLENVKRSETEDPNAVARARGYPERVMNKLKGLPRRPPTEG